MESTTPNVGPVPDRGPADPFVAIDADLDSLPELTPVERVAAFGRIHTGLTSALAATAISADGTPGGGR